MDLKVLSCIIFFPQNTFMSIMILKSKNTLYFSEQPVLTAEICHKKAQVLLKHLKAPLLRLLVSRDNEPTCTITARVSKAAKWNSGIINFHIHTCAPRRVNCLPLGKDLRAGGATLP